MYSIIYNITLLMANSYNNITVAIQKIAKEGAQSSGGRGGVYVWHELATLKLETISIFEKLAQNFSFPPPSPPSNLPLQATPV